MIRGRCAAAAAVLLLAVAAAPARAESESYEVRAGDTLWSIAGSVLGDPSLWPALYRANRDRIKDPREVYPGQRLSVPRIAPGDVRAVRREAETLLEP